MLSQVFAHSSPSPFVLLCPALQSCRQDRLRAANGKERVACACAVGGVAVRHPSSDLLFSGENVAGCCVLGRDVLPALSTVVGDSPGLPVLRAISTFECLCLHVAIPLWGAMDLSGWQKLITLLLLSPVPVRENVPAIQ